MYRWHVNSGQHLCTFLYGSNEKQLLTRSDWFNCVNDQSHSACSAEARHPLRTAGAQPECHDRGQGHRSSCAKQYGLVPNLYKISFSMGKQTVMYSVGQVSIFNPYLLLI